MAAAIAAPHQQRDAVDVIHDLVAEAEEQQIKRRARGLGRLQLVPSQLCSGEPAMRRRKIDLSRAAPRREAGGDKIAAAAHLTHKKWNQN